MFSKEEVDNYLKNILDLGSSNKMFDIHVHPFEVIFGGLNNFCDRKYCEGCHQKKYAYNPPQAETLQILQSSHEPPPQVDFSMKVKCSSLAFRRLYRHSCIKVFADHMRLSGIGKAFLLPVVGPDESADEKMVLMNDIFGGDERFELGYCVPNEVDLESIDLKIKENVRRYGIKILKIHPNITEINLDSILGVERVETILESSQKNKLKVIVHGGRSPILKNEGAVSFATMKNLEKIDWSITSEAVTIAHAGAFGCDTLEIKGEVLPKLKKMLAKYDNLYVDLSGIEFGDLCLILKSLDTDRIVFGSDSFYEYQWKGLVRLFAALQTSSSRVEESFLKICSLNYSHLFARDALC